MTTALVVILSSVAGACVSSLMSCIPGLHIYNILGPAIVGVHGLNAVGVMVPEEAVASFTLAAVVGFSILNTIPSIFLAAPDESAIFTVLPGQKYLMQGRGYEATLLTVAGGMAGLFVLVVAIGVFGPMALPVAKVVFQQHTHWILWTVIAFMLMSEWPKGGNLGQAGWRKFFDAWRSTGSGLLVFFMSGLLGFLLLYRSPIAAEAAFQNLMPAFVGLFTLPALIINLVSKTAVPPQVLKPGHFCDGRVITRGAAAGILGGGFAAFFPVITGGTGGLLAGHAMAVRDDKVFLVSQGASKTVYYVGGLLLFFVPGLHITRGGAASMLNTFYEPWSRSDFYMALASILLAGAVSFMLVGVIVRAVLMMIAKIGYERISWMALLLALALVAAGTGVQGLLIMTTATGIGLLPLLMGSRRMNCLGVILLPMACNMSGFGSDIAGYLGLM